MAGLSPEQVVFILTSPLPAAVIGRQFGCSHQAICDVRNNKTYRHVYPDVPRFNTFSTRRLDPKQVAYIRESDESLGALAKRFNVSKRTIISAKRGETYRNTRMPLPRTASEPNCMNCIHWSPGCGLGFPEATEDTVFAAECSLFTLKSSKS